VTAGRCERHELEVLGGALVPVLSSISLLVPSRRAAADCHANLGVCAVEADRA
jgi:hypothetical protein